MVTMDKLLIKNKSDEEILNKYKLHHEKAKISVVVKNRAEQLTNVNICIICLDELHRRKKLKSKDVIQLKFLKRVMLNKKYRLVARQLMKKDGFELLEYKD